MKHKSSHRTCGSFLFSAPADRLPRSGLCVQLRASRQLLLDVRLRGLRHNAHCCADETHQMQIQELRHPWVG